MTILITGAAKRLGKYLALNLASKGNKLVITYNTSSEQDLAELKKAGIHCIKADLTNKEDLEFLSVEVKKNFPDLSAIIHNAALWLPNSIKIDEELTNFEIMYKLNMQAPLYLNQVFEKTLIASATKRKSTSNIIHITDAVVQKTAQNHIAYAATKAGLEYLSKSFARKFAPFIRVNSIAPSLLAYNIGDSDEYKIKAQKKSLLPPAPGFGVALKSVEYILNNEYLTGTSLNLDGGRSCL